MSSTSKIEWTEQTWNPVTGCDKVSAGCKHCYAETLAKRLQTMRTPGYEDGFAVTLQSYRLREPLRRKKPTLYFVCSMSDLFHPDVPFSYIDQVMAVMAKANQHTFQILTKRSERMRDYFIKHPVPNNVWLGVTVENRQAMTRMTHLKTIPAKTRFLSVEPLLEDLGKLDLSWIHQVIVGGESGKDARPMHPVWVDNLLHWCQVYHVPFFFKQWGNYGHDGIKRSKKANGRVFNGRVWDGAPTTTHDRFPVPVVASPKHCRANVPVQLDLFKAILP